MLPQNYVQVNTFLKLHLQMPYLLLRAIFIFAPNHAVGKAIKTSAIAYHAGPSSRMTIAPAMLTPKPMNPPIMECRIGLSGASSVVM